MRGDVEAIRGALRCGRPGCVCQRGKMLHCLAHPDEHPSLSLVEEDGRILVRCHAGCSQGAVIETLRQLGLWPARNDARAGPVRETWYPLRDPDGNPVAVHVRHDRLDGSKSFNWQRPDGASGLGGRPVADLPLYGVHRLRDRPGEPLILVEGEKVAQTLLDAGRLALGTVTGAGTIPSEDALRPLLGRDLILWPDADEPGRTHMQRIGARLQALGVTPRLVEWLDAPPGGDAADFITRQGAGEALEGLLADARPGADHQGRVVLIRLSDVSPKAVRWLWPGRIPLGKVTVLDGDPGLAKSLISLDLASRVTRGASMPDGVLGDLAGPHGVVLLTAEDDLEDTVRPRLETAGADVGRIVVLARVKDSRGERMPTIADLDALDEAIKRVNALLTIIDPLMAYVPDARDTHRDQDIRRALAPLAGLAACTGVAILVVRHLNKSGGDNPLYRGGGSIGIIGAARSGLLVAPDPEAPDNGRRILAVTKANLSELPVALAYRVDDMNGVAHIVWEGATLHTASGLLAATIPEEERSALKEAEGFLLQVLAAGPLAAKQVQAEARGLGISERTLNRAKASTGVVTSKDGFARGWTWALPTRQGMTIPAEMAPKIAKPPEDCQNLEYGALGSLRHPWQPSREKGALANKEPQYEPRRSFAALAPSGGEDPDITPEDRARAGGRGALILQVGNARDWRSYSYGQGRSIGAGRRAWATFVRNNPVQELVVAAEAMSRDPGLARAP